ncbi:MAG: flagellar biosynthesis protein FliQ [bacterium]
MTLELIVEILSEAFYIVMLILLPILGVSLIIGVVISIFQAATSIQEMTLTFVPKIIITAITVLIMLPFISEKLMDFTLKIFNMFGTAVK